MAKYMSDQKKFYLFLNYIFIFYEKKIVVYGKPFIKAIGILLLIVRFAKSRDHTLIQTIKKN